METIIGSVCDKCKHIMSVRYKIHTVKCAKCGTIWVLGWRQDDEIQQGRSSEDQPPVGGGVITGRSSDGIEEEPKMGGREGKEGEVEGAPTDSEPSVS